MSYEKKINRIGIIGMLVAIVGNFMPVAYLAIFKGLSPSFSQVYKYGVLQQQLTE